MIAEFLELYERRVREYNAEIEKIDRRIDELKKKKLRLEQKREVFQTQLDLETFDRNRRGISTNE